MDKSLLERITFCNQLKCKEHQDLFWLLSSEALSQKLIPKNHFNISISSFEELVSELNTLSPPNLFDTKLRLGKYAEKLIAYYLINLSDYRVIESQLQLFENNITKGEIDFILEKNNEFIHLEFAIKYYVTITKRFTEYWGPNFKDCWSQKKEKLINQQMQLCTSYNKLLPEQLKNVNFKKKALVLGCLFFHDNNNLNWFVYKNEIEKISSLGKYFSLIPKKQNWIYPFAIQKLINFDQLSVELKNLSDNYIMVVCYDQKKIPNSWGFYLNKTIPKNL